MGVMYINKSALHSPPLNTCEKLVNTYNLRANGWNHRIRILRCKVVSKIKCLGKHELKLPHYPTVFLVYDLPRLRRLTPCHTDQHRQHMCVHTPAHTPVCTHCCWNSRMTTRRWLQPFLMKLKSRAQCPQVLPISGPWAASALHTGPSRGDGQILAPKPRLQTAHVPQEW